MRETAYAYAVARIRAIETRLLTKSDLDLLLTSKSTDECMRILSDKGFGGSSISLETSSSKLLSDDLMQSWNLVKEIAPEPKIFNMFLYKNDFHNLKVIIKSIVKGVKYDDLMLYPNTIDVNVLREAVVENKFDILPLFMRDAAMLAYDTLTRTGDSQLFSIVLDKASLYALYNDAKSTKSSFIIGLARLICDCANVKTAVRSAMTERTYDFILNALVDVGGISVKQLAISGGTDLGSISDYLLTTSFASGAELLKDSVSSLEKWCDDLIISYLRRAKFQAFGVEPLIAYLFAKETEVKVVRIILTGKANNLPENSVRERLRELYV